jgi:hypothetical protein
MIHDVKAQATFVGFQLQEYKYMLPYVVGVALLGLALFMRGCTPPTPAPAASVVSEAIINPAVIEEKKVDTPLLSPRKTVRTYGAAAKGLITLPKTVAEDDNKLVTDSVQLQPSEKRQVVTQVLDIGTGETVSYTHTLPDPWLALEDRGAISLDYGFKRGSTTPVGRINLRQDFLQVKSLHVGVTGSMYSDGDYFVGVGGSYRW